MPNNPKQISAILALMMLVTITGCASTPVDPGILLEADDAIELAQRTGARDHAPLELDEALELRNQAAGRIAADEADAAARLAERAAMQARLAIVRAEGARARNELDRKRNDLDRLNNELHQAFGDAIDTRDDL